MVKKENKMMAKVGSWAFIVGVLLAVIMGLWTDVLGSVGVTVLILLGLIVGLLNITGRETMPYIAAVIALMLVTAFGGNVLSQAGYIGPALESILNAIMVFIIPATIIVALKTVYSLAEDE